MNFVLASQDPLFRGFRVASVRLSAELVCQAYRSRA